jgi:hypothetical protein
MYQVQQVCACGKKYWPNQAWQHNGCASNQSMANPSLIKTYASNKEGIAGPIVCREEVGAIDLGRDGRSGVDGRPALTKQGDLPNPVNRKQRWSRESYNAYQREYMKKRRAK